MIDVASPEKILDLLADKVAGALKERGIKLVTAESCTGGWVAQAITKVAGSSAWFERGFVSYSDAAKQEMLGVASDTLQHFGAVSEDVVREMAAGALSYSHAQISLAVSGIAGPGGATKHKPVGTVCLAWADTGLRTHSQTTHFLGNRDEVRRQAVIAALTGLLEFMKGYA